MDRISVCVRLDTSDDCIVSASVPGFQRCDADCSFRCVELADDMSSLSTNNLRYVSHVLCLFRPIHVSLQILVFVLGSFFERSCQFRRQKLST